MLTLSLLRHAKSSWSDARLKDFDRPLNERGLKEAPRIGTFMARRGLVPALVLCSPAARARQTLNLVRPTFKPAPQVVYEDALYLASPRAMLKRIEQVTAEARHLMLVGHNPGLQELALELTGAGPAEALEAVAQKLPTAGLVILSFDADSWSKIKPGAGRLEAFMSPKRLETDEMERSG
ncbi:MAG TPA: histidine phosphatase family protein [Hyphomicrobiaceae bacterium]|nr:histidine phosphatase family protein [Hyphomicrobiaceae bacterium]